LALGGTGPRPPNRDAAVSQFWAFEIRSVDSLPIRLSHTATTCRVLPIAGIKLVRGAVARLLRHAFTFARASALVENDLTLARPIVPIRPYLISTVIRLRSLTPFGFQP
jgi:hypothetical protein